MTRTTRWTPDSCGCVLEYTWDDASAEATRTHTPARVVSACPAHRGLDLATHFGTVVAENRHRNRVFAAILAAVPERSATTPDGVIIFHPATVPTWDFDSNRDLRVQFPGWTAQERAKAQMAMAGLRKATTETL